MLRGVMRWSTIMQSDNSPGNIDVLIARSITANDTTAIATDATWTLAGKSAVAICFAFGNSNMPANVAIAPAKMKGLLLPHAKVQLSLK